MDAKKGTSGEQQLASLRQRRLKGHDIHTKKHATPSQVRANHEHQQKQQQKMTTTTTTTTVSNGAGAAANNKSAQSNKVSIEKRIKDESSGTSSGSNCKAPTSREQKQVNSRVSNRARVESAGSSLDKNLEIYSARAKEIKVQIGAALEKQAKFHEIKQLNDVSELRNSILELTNMQQDDTDSIVVEDNIVNNVQANFNDKQQVQGGPALEDAEQSHQMPNESGAAKEETRAGQDKAQLEDKPSVLVAKETEPIVGQLKELEIGATNDDQRDGKVIARTETAAPVVPPVHDNNNSESELQASKQQQQQQQQVASNKLHKKSKLNTNSSSSSGSSSSSSSSLQATPTTAICVDDSSPPLTLSNNLGFEPLAARLDPKSKFIALKSSLEKHFVKCPELLDPICKQLVHLTGQIDSLVMYNEQNQFEIQKLSSIKGKLSELCRELQRSNNQIRIESLDMIKGEQNKAKEQAGKIQSTLSGVMKLFDENQQRNLSLKQENIELQAKLKSILEHCDNWEKCVETTLKQRELENRLIKTEMAKLSLVHQEEKEKFFKEKKELLQALTMMKLQQNKIEEKEAKLRSDLTNYASKYDECQEIIHKGLSKFKVESKRMLKQIETSRQDYIHLLGKYEASNKKIKQLLEEKQSWAKSLGAANKKTDTLERLCRTLKADNDKLLQQQHQQQHQQQQSAGNISLDTTIETSEPLVVQSQVITGPIDEQKAMTLQ